MSERELTYHSKNKSKAKGHASSQQSSERLALATDVFEVLTPSIDMSASNQKLLGVNMTSKKRGRPLLSSKALNDFTPTKLPSLLTQELAQSKSVMQLGQHTQSSAKAPVGQLLFNRGEDTVSNITQSRRLNQSLFPRTTFQTQSEENVQQANLQQKSAFQSNFQPSRDGSAKHDMPATQANIHSSDGIQDDKFEEEIELKLKFKKIQRNNEASLQQPQKEYQQGARMSMQNLLQLRQQPDPDNKIMQFLDFAKKFEMRNGERLQSVIERIGELVKEIVKLKSEHSAQNIVNDFTCYNTEIHDFFINVHSGEIDINLMLDAKRFLRKFIDAAVRRSNKTKQWKWAPSRSLLEGTIDLAYRLDQYHVDHFRDGIQIMRKRLIDSKKKLQYQKKYLNKEKNNLMFRDLLENYHKKKFAQKQFQEYQKCQYNLNLNRMDSNLLTEVQRLEYKYGPLPYIGRIARGNAVEIDGVVTALKVAKTQF